VDAAGDLEHSGDLEAGPERDDDEALRRAWMRRVVERLIG
jgi:hypothetical protein